MSNTKLFSFGGTDGHVLFNDIWSFDLHTGLWLKIEADGFLPSARESCASAMAEDVIYIIGGKGENGVELNDLCAYKIKSRRWFRFQNMGPSPSPRHGLTMTAVSHRLIVLGGDNETAKMEDASSIFILDSTKIKYPTDTPQQQQSMDSTNSERIMNGYAHPSPQQPHSPQQYQPQYQPHPPPQQQQQGGQVPQQHQPSPQPQQQQQQGSYSPQQQHQTIQKPHPDQRQNQRLNPPSSPLQQLQPRSVAAAVMNANAAYTEPPVRPPRHISTVPEAALRRPRATSPLPPSEADIVADIRLTPNSASSPSPRPNKAQQDHAKLQQEHAAATAAANEERQALLREIQTRDAIISEMKKKENWWRTEVSLARKQRVKSDTFDDGPDADEALLMDVDHLSEDKVKIFEQLVAVKSELRRVRTSIFQQAQPMSEKVGQADRMRTAALQEAAYFKSKYLALKARRQEDLENVEISRCDTLEKRLAAALTENEANGKLLQQLQKKSQHDQSARQATEERAHEAQARAEEAQQAHQRALEELQTVYARATKAEVQVRDNAVKIADLTQQLSDALTSQPVVKSQEVTEAQLKASQLEAANLKARNEAATLKQKLAENMDDIARLRTLLHEREDALTEAKIHVEDCEIQLSMMREAMNQQQQQQQKTSSAVSNTGFAPTRAY
ncbi:hypothetical protein FB192DRAFT_1277691 [Mucor lusitanicus]|uniref:Galactose oxidase n=1 Tax=Mucor circinelloides f. lusitanicus TaxID=29924 RepID=A0A8H4BKM5_MUCCL|nr:hypothetical protein FB192DRAFT_1277691 [Mucor lusitanicus]